MPTARPSNGTLDETQVAGLLGAIERRGFPLAGALDLDLAREAFAPHADRYREWLAAGFQGEMGYLERGLDRRMDPRIVFPETRSIWSVAIPYRRHPTASPDAGGPRYARYLEGPDYHRRLPELLESALEEWATAHFAEGERPRWKICVDTSAVLERSWAALAGLGWIGKNSLLINPRLGSYLFLGTVLLDRATARAPAPLPNYCGNCTACLDGCPTSALVAPGKLDSRRCIAYLTLEKRGEWPAADPALPAKIGTWVAGCDVCQEVCPYNRKPARMEETWPTDPRDEALVTDWERLAGEGEADYRRRIAGSALTRIKFPDMVRNLAQARRNAAGGGDQDAGGSPNSNA